MQIAKASWCMLACVGLLAVCGVSVEAQTTSGGAAPTISALMDGVTATEGAAATFTVTVSGDPRPTLQWQRSNDSGATWTDIAGQTRDSYMLTKAQLSDHGAQFRVLATNSQGMSFSQVASLTVKSGVSMSSSQVASLTVKSGVSYYVATTGSDSAAGSPSKPWKTISHAVKTAPAGATIYVKAGVYADSVAFTKDGQSLIGYKTTPGDQPLIMSSVATATTQGITYPDFDGAEMPLIQGANRSRGTGMSLRGRKNITVKNIAIANFREGLIAGNRSQNFVENHTLFNVNVSTIGSTSGYSGFGISLGSMGTQFSNNNTVTHALIINAAAEGLTLNGNDNTAGGIKVFSSDPEDRSGTDYYVMVCGDRNLVKNSLIYRKVGLRHAGHGFSVKSNAEQVVDKGLSVPVVNPQYNTFENNTAINLGEGFVVRHRGARFNTFRNNFAYGSYTGYGSNDQGNGIRIRDGASDNLFINTTIENTRNAVSFNDTVEDGDYGKNPSGHPGDNNIVDGAHVTNSLIGVYFFEFSVPSDAGGNIIRNSSFTLTRRMFTVERRATRMKYINVSFGGTDKMSPKPGGYFRGGTYADDIVPSQFTGCTFSDIEGGLPDGF